MSDKRKSSNKPKNNQYKSKKCNTENSNKKNSNKFTVKPTTMAGSTITITAITTKTIMLPAVLLMLLLLQCCQHCCWAAEPVATAVVANRSGPDGKVSDNVLPPAAASQYCVVVLANNTELQQQIGAVWVSSENPCTTYTCEQSAKEAGRGTRVTITEENCGEFYCDVDSELRKLPGTCCGACVRTKCRHNERVYDVGQTWHNANDCTLLECALLPSGQPIINAYQKSCPALEANCASDQMYVEDCCQYCRTTNVSAGQPRVVFSEQEDIWTEEFYRRHPCVRDCQAGEAPRTCHYTFVVEWYETLSKACYNCPHNATDCARPHCILGDGVPRSVTVVNRMMPGPSIEVCENDVIVVDVKNHMLGESTTIHWHGMHQRATPYMDGVPHITQCPISPHATFRYTFIAENAGTHFWHSHTGMQRGDGVFGALIVRQPRSVDPHGHLYDFDLSEHKMIVQDWVHVPGISMFASHHHSRGDNKPRNLLINGKGRYYQAIWEQVKLEANMSARGIKTQQNESTTVVNAGTTELPVEISTAAVDAQVTEQGEWSTEIPSDFLDSVDFLHSWVNTEENHLRMTESNEISRLARLARANTNAEKSSESATMSQASSADSQSPDVKVESTRLFLDSTERLTRGAVQNPTTTTVAPTIQLNQTVPVSADGIPKSTKLNATTNSTHIRMRRSADNFTIPLDAMPLQVYTVRRGFRYRFRIINAEFLNCPITVSIDNHSLTAINSDGYDFEPVEVGSIVTYAGERFDFVVNANQPVGSYWVRLKGLMDCSELFTSAFQVAILRYEGAPANAEPNGVLGYQHKAEGIELNVMNRGPGHVDSLTVAELTGLQYYDRVPGIDRDALKPVADYKFFVYYDFYVKNNPEFHPEEYYGVNANLSSANRLFTPQLNHISLKFPSVALLPARDELDASMFCNETSLEAQGINCREQFCKCHHVLQVPLNSVIELIIIDEGFTFDANHPFHLHGNAFRVVGLERLGSNVTVEMIKQLDRYNLLKRNLVRPPIKDTVTVPDGGYTIVRFEAYNPGFWLFHCHIEFHAEIGMALVLKVGDNDEMHPVPKNFPTCHDYMPDAGDSDKGNDIAQDKNEQTTTKMPERSAGWSNRRAAAEGCGVLLLALFTSIIKLRWSSF